MFRAWSRNDHGHEKDSLGRIRQTLLRKQYSYEKGNLPVCDAMSERAALLTIASVLTDEDIDDIVEAFHKVGRVLLPH